MFMSVCCCCRGREPRTSRGRLKILMACEETARRKRQGRGEEEGTRVPFSSSPARNTAGDPPIPAAEILMGSSAADGRWKQKISAESTAAKRVRRGGDLSLIATHPAAMAEIPLPLAVKQEVSRTSAECSGRLLVKVMQPLLQPLSSIRHAGTYTAQRTRMLLLPLLLSDEFCMLTERTGMKPLLYVCSDASSCSSCSSCSWRTCSF
mmetsp:Transcript_22851/g.74595  ORF Transcript_22851/g.74595 Transcript_22851/m.74595 type:complete len:207 (-) Transcript_22851:569-1189(-)